MASSCRCCVINHLGLSQTQKYVRMVERKHGMEQSRTKIRQELSSRNPNHASSGTVMVPFFQIQTVQKKCEKKRQKKIRAPQIIDLSIYECVRLCLYTRLCTYLPSVQK